MDKPGPRLPSRVDLTPWAAFARRDFTLLWFGGVAGTVTMVLRTLISAQWLYEETGSAVQLGLLGAVQLVQMPVVLYGGTLADRMDRKVLMALTQGVAFAMLVSLTVLAAMGGLKPWHIFAITGVSGVVNMLGSSARPAMLPRVVPRHLITHAVTSQTASFQVSGIVAPIVFWQVFEHFGVTVAFAVTAAVALASVVAPLLIGASGRPEEQAPRTTIRSLKEGYAFVMGHPLLPGLYSLDIGVTVVSFYRQLFPVFADQLYGLGAAGTGLLNTANSIGGVLGTMVVLYTTRVSGKGVLVLLATVAYAVLLLAFGVNRFFVVGLVIVALLGMTDSVGMTMRQTIVQLTTPDRLLGRASSAHSFSAMTANHLGQVEVGVLSGAIGAGNTMVLGGIISIVVVAAIWRLIPGIRRYRYDPDNPYEDA